MSVKQAKLTDGAPLTEPFSNPSSKLLVSGKVENSLYFAFGVPFSNGYQKTSWENKLFLVCQLDFGSPGHIET